MKLGFFPLGMTTVPEQNLASFHLAAGGGCLFRNTAVYLWQADSPTPVAENGKWLLL